MRLAPLLVFGLVALAGCAAQPSGSESPSPSFTTIVPSDLPTETITPDAAPSALQLNLDSIESVDASGLVLESVGFDQPVSEVVALVEKTLGHAPTVENRAEHPCTLATGVTFYWWGDHSILVTYETDPGALASWRQPGAYRVSFIAGAVGSIELRGAQGLRVGDDAAALLAAVPEADIGQVTASAVMAVAEVGGSWVSAGGEGHWGLSAAVDNGVVTSWVSPSYILDFYC